MRSGLLVLFAAFVAAMPADLNGLPSDHEKRVDEKRDWDHGHHRHGFMEHDGFRHREKGHEREHFESDHSIQECKFEKHHRECARQKEFERDCCCEVHREHEKHLCPPKKHHCPKDHHFHCPRKPTHCDEKPSCHHRHHGHHWSRSEEEKRGWDHDHHKHHGHGHMKEISHDVHRGHEHDREKDHFEHGHAIQECRFQKHHKECSREREFERDCCCEEHREHDKHFCPPKPHHCKGFHCPHKDHHRHHHKDHWSRAAEGEKCPNC